MTRLDESALLEQLRRAVQQRDEERSVSATLRAQMLSLESDLADARAEQRLWTGGSEDVEQLRRELQEAEESVRYWRRRALQREERW